jgi:hypothetical protein
MAIMNGDTPHLSRFEGEIVKLVHLMMKKKDPEKGFFYEGRRVTERVSDHLP